ncbi:GntR family transcriptional regulator [Streptomyces sp. NPDC047070]|uniref:GntR family transcriptional regulator n=1 Tax=Streptomyces sp. NPDC047070 TaxID=3154923 RepID=UPI003454D307
MTYNLLTGGVDSGVGGRSEARFDTQLGILKALAPDVLALEECTFWDENGSRRLKTVAKATGMSVVAMLASRTGDGRNHTALLYRPAKLRLIDRRQRGKGVLHHAMIQARLRPLGVPDGSADFTALATHLAFTDGDTRLAEVRGWATDFGGAFPGTPSRAMLLGDLNCPRVTDSFDWTKVPPNLHARYRLVLPDGRFGDADLRAMQVLLASGWQDPETLTTIRRAPTVGYYYAGERGDVCLDHILTRGFTVHAYWTYDTPMARAVSDHLPAVLDAEIGLQRPEAADGEASEPAAATDDTGHHPPAVPGPVTPAQVRDVIEQRLGDGTYKAGQKLPSQKELAAELGVNQGVIAQALQPLKDKGIVYARGVLGTIVVDPANPGLIPRAQHEVARIIRQRMREGTYAVGTLLPSRADLATEFAVSTHLIHSIQKGLKREGLVTGSARSQTYTVVACPPEERSSPPAPTFSESVRKPLENAVRQRITDGVYAPLTWLPPMRVLAEDFGISVSTAWTALAPLKEEGLLATARLGTTPHRMTYVVDPADPTALPETPPPRLREKTPDGNKAQGVGSGAAAQATTPPEADADVPGDVRGSHTGACHSHSQHSVQEIHP